MKTILISNKNRTKISKEARELLVLRDMAHQDHKRSGDPGDLRVMRHYTNQANKQIARDNFIQRARRLKDNKISDRERWRRVKTQTGQNTFKSPTIIIEGQKHHQSPKDMAAALNRQYITKIRNIVNQMPPEQTTPLDNFKRYVGRDDLTFSFKIISMSQLRTLLSKMKPTTSASDDDIPMRAIKLASRQLEPLLLHLSDLVISQATYPESLRTSKIVPIRKQPKDEQTAEGWRPINIGSSVSKVIEKILTQIMEHLVSNDLIMHLAPWVWYDPSRHRH